MKELGIFVFLLGLCTVHSVSAGGVAKVEGASAKDVPIGRLGLRLAYNSHRGPVAGFSYISRRFMGTDALFRIGAEASKEDSRFNVSLRNDSIFDGSPKFGLNVYHHETWTSNTFGFSTTATGVEPKLVWTLSDRMLLTARTRASWDEIDDLVAGSSALISADAGSRSRQSVGLRLDFTLPGMLVSKGHISGDFAATSRDTSYLKFMAGLSHQTASRSGNFVFGNSAQGGVLELTGGSATSIGDRFFLGQSTVRGFDIGGFGPRDVNAAGQPALGGNTFFAVRNDVYLPRLFGEDSKVIPGLFLDAGAMWKLNSVGGGASGTQMVDDSFHLRASVGVSLQFKTRFGPFYINAAYPLLKQAYDRDQIVTLGYKRSY